VPVRFPVAHILNSKVELNNACMKVLHLESTAPSPTPPFFHHTHTHTHTHAGRCSCTHAMVPSSPRSRRVTAGCGVCAPGHATTMWPWDVRTAAWLATSSSSAPCTVRGMCGWGAWQMWLGVCVCVVKEGRGWGGQHMWSFVLACVGGVGAQELCLLGVWVGCTTDVIN